MNKLNCFEKEIRKCVFPSLSNVYLRRSAFLISSLSFLTVSLTASFASFKASPTFFPPSSECSLTALALSSTLPAWSLTVSAASLTPDLTSSAASLTLSAAFPAASFAPFAASSTLSLTFPKYCQIRERKGSWELPRLASFLGISPNRSSKYHSKSCSSRILRFPS